MAEQSTSRSQLNVADINVCFIGAGNMASALVQGLLKPSPGSTSGAGVLGKHQINVSDPDPLQTSKMSELGVSTFVDNEQAIAQADAIVLAVKPQIAGPVVKQLATLSPDQLIISIAAGINIASLSQWSSAQQSIVRCMPNTPALLGAGMTALYANNNCTDAQRTLAELILNAAGETLWVTQEQELDAVTAVSGSGPAYFFALMEAMISAGETLGLSSEVATQLTLQTAYGAALMAQSSPDNPATLRQNVTSPGGTTQAALEIFESKGFNKIVNEALHAANTRAAQLSEEFGR